MQELLNKEIGELACVEVIDYNRLTNSVSAPMTNTRKQDSRNVNEYLPDSTAFWRGKNGGYEWKTTE